MSNFQHAVVLILLGKKMRIEGNHRLEEFKLTFLPCEHSS